MLSELCDVRHATRLTELITRFRPERIFHLAVQSYPTVSLLQPREAADVNVGGTKNLYECLRAENLSPVVVTTCSNAEYGPLASRTSMSARRLVRAR
jgi:GDP-4-dehydro-6-deoxy-D-mannose reductase